MNISLGEVIAASALLITALGGLSAYIVSAVRSATSSLGTEIRSLARSMDELRIELHQQRQTIQEHGEAIAVLKHEHQNGARGGRS